MIKPQTSEIRPSANEGFILTQQSFDNNGCAEIHLWLATDAGPVALVVSDEKPLFFVRQADLERVKETLGLSRILESRNYKLRLLPLKNFKHQKVAALYFNSLQAFYDARSCLQQAGIESFEAQFRLHERFLMERFVYGSLKFAGQPVYENGQLKYTNAKIKSANYTPTLKVVSVDIECSERGELYSIGFYGEYQNQTLRRVMMIGDPSAGAEDYIHWVSDEQALLIAFEQQLVNYDPDLIIGWNVINFDFRLLYQRALSYGRVLKIGRGGSGLRWRDSTTDFNQGFATLQGRVIIDGIAALKAEAYQFPSFSLEAMAQHFLGEGKATEDVDNRMQAINHDFQFNKPKLAAYNLQDCVLVWRIFEATKLLDFLVFRSQLTGLELDRAGGSVAAFTNLYLPKLHRQGYVSPNLPEDGGLASPGGYVMESSPGLYHNVLVLDFKSLYPSIIRTFKIDPLGLVEGLEDPENAVEGFKGGVFSREKHLLPEIITELWALRDKAKRDQDAARSQAIKILMNSFYGVLGSGGCAFYDTRLASSITMRGHWIMQQTAAWIEGLTIAEMLEDFGSENRPLKVIYGDTDSTFVLLGQQVSSDQATQLGNRLAQLINQRWAEKLKLDFNLDCDLEIEFETLFKRFLMPTIRGSEKGSKKRYAGVKGEGEGEEMKLVFKGLENVRTDWTMLARNFQESLYAMVFSDRDPGELIKNVIAETLAGKNDGQLIYRKRLRKPLEEYTKNVPPHVKAARLADEENERLGRPLKYQHKGWIRYVITTAGPQPVEYVTSPLDYEHYIEKQIEPVAEAILPFIGMDFKVFTSNQLGLF